MNPVRTVSALALGAVLLLAVGCSDDSSTGPTTSPGTSSSPNTTAATATTNSSTSAPADTEETTSTVIITSATDPNETRAGETTTTAPTFEQLAALARAQAVVEAAPEGWTSTVAPAVGLPPTTSESVLYTNCKGEDGYDFTNLDADSQAAYQVTVQQTPEDGGVAPEANLEVRSFTRESTAQSVYDTMVATLTTDEGRECLKESLPTTLAGNAPPGATFEAEVTDTTIEGGDAGAHVTVTLTSGAQSVVLELDLLTTQLDDGSVIFASFFAVGDPVDPEAASALLTAMAA